MEEIKPKRCKNYLNCNLVVSEIFNLLWKKSVICDTKTNNDKIIKGLWCLQKSNKNNFWGYYADTIPQVNIISGKASTASVNSVRGSWGHSEHLSKHFREMDPPKKIFRL